MDRSISMDAAGPRDEKVSSFKLSFVQYAILGIFLLLVSGLWRLEVMGGERYESLAEQNRIRKVPILAPRGKIFDREGRLIVDNRPSTSAFLLREQLKNADLDFPLIAKGLGMTVGEIQERIRHYALAPKFEPIPLKDDISENEYEFIEAHRDELPELETVSVSRRLYPKNGFAAHLLGYVGEVSEEMVREQGRQPGEVVGRSGVEAQYNDMLVGTNGSRMVLVNSVGKELGRVGTEPAKIGKDLKLTIDLDLQMAAEEAMQGRNGAVVAMDPRNGEILAMVSRPAFDPNAFSVKISREGWNGLINDPAKPLMNKAIQAQLAPGSTFKIIMSLAGLQENIAQSLHVNCPGSATFYGHLYHCHAKHGAVEITKAIYQSCDVFFYTLAQRLGIDRVAKYAQALGLGQKTGIDLPQEVSGTMPSEEWKERLYHQKWYAGETISVGIGQGAIAATPIQMARAIGGIGSGGVLRRPHVVFDDELTDEYKQVQYAQPDKVTVALSQQNWFTITDSMTRVVGPEGTAPSAHLQGIDLAGKTGSTQLISNDALKRMNRKKSDYRGNAWFVGFTPRRNPEIVVCVLFLQGEEGKLSARLAAKIISAYVEKQRRKDHNLIADDKAEKKTADLGHQESSDGRTVEMAAFWSGQQDLPQSDSGNTEAGNEVARRQEDQDDDPSQRLGAGIFEVPIGEIVLAQSGKGEHLLQ